MPSSAAAPHIVWIHNSPFHFAIDASNVFAKKLWQGRRMESAPRSQSSQPSDPGQRETRSEAVIGILDLAEVLEAVIIGEMQMPVAVM
ncbi:MAG: hypothetical protein ABSC61_11785 [Anaerolineales bacterium]